MATTNGVHQNSNFYRFAAFHHKQFRTACIGHLDLERNTITPLSYLSGTPLRTLYEVIEVGEQNITASGDPIPRSECKLLAPIYGRDILAVGKNYAVSITANRRDCSEADIASGTRKGVQCLRL